MFSAALPLSSAVRLRLTDKQIVVLRLRRLGRPSSARRSLARIGGAAAEECGAVGKAEPYRTGERLSRVRYDR